MNHNALSKPLLFDSPLKTRLQLAKNRLEAYPLSDMNFLLMDLEHPMRHRRHADFCTYDLTGRTLLFYALADGIDGTHIQRLPELYKRIMNNRRIGGQFEDCPAGEPSLVSTQFVSGLVNYYALTGDMRALNAAQELADDLLSRGDAFFARLQSKGAHKMEAWITEGFADLYRETKDEKYLDAVRHIARACMGSFHSAHSHGYLTTLRGIMRAAISANDHSLAELVKERRQEILHNGITEIGDISEMFPRSHRNEGCSISDWIMLNLLYAHYYDDAEAYAVAEYSLWNALCFNQFVTGGFGHRDFAHRGYRASVQEAWWCCTQNAGTCFAELARYAVTVQNGKLHLNFLIPGEFTLPNGITVRVTTQYPTKAAAIIQVTGTKEDISLRIPDYIKSATLHRVETDFGYTLYLDGKMGHYAEKKADGYVLKYGPLVLAPMKYTWDMQIEDFSQSTVPEGYVQQNMPAQQCMLELGQADENGFYHFAHDPIPRWLIFAEGEMAEISGGEVAAAHIPVCFSDGSKQLLYFQPICSATTNLVLTDIPVVFDLKEGI